MISCLQIAIASAVAAVAAAAVAVVVQMNEQIMSNKKLPPLPRGVCLYNSRQFATLFQVFVSLSPYLFLFTFESLTSLT